MADTVTATADNRLRRRPWVAPAALLLLALALYSINLDKPPRFDELYHVLGARGYLEYGEPRIAEGIYDRTALFTAVIAGLFKVLGEGLVVARLPAVICGALLTATLFSWTRAVAGSAAAWCAALLFLISPFSVDVFQDIRFYAPQALFFWLGAIATYTAAAPQEATRTRILAAVGAALALTTALYLQIVTVIGLLGIGLWLGVSLLHRWLPGLGRGVRVRVLVAVFAAALALAGAVLALFGPELLHAYRSTPLFDAPTRNHFWYYHFWFDLYYPTIWPLFPFAALAAVALQPRPALFCLSIFVPAMLLHAFAGSKGLLYIFYATPPFFVVIGMALAFAAPYLVIFARQLVDGAAKALGFVPRRWLRTAAIGTGLVFLILANTASVRVATMLAGITVPPEIPPEDWPGVAERLRPWLTKADVVLTGDELFTLYYLGRYDALVGKSRMSELADGVDFTRDYRTGRPVVSTPQGVARIIDCSQSGLFVTNLWRWRHTAHIDDAIADVITARAEPLDLPKSSRILAFVWQHPEPAPDTAVCADIRAALSKHAG